MHDAVSPDHERRWPILAVIGIAQLMVVLDARGRAPTPRVLRAATVHGYTTAFWVSASIFAGGAGLLSAIVPNIRAGAAAPEGAPTEAIGPEPIGREAIGREASRA